MMRFIITFARYVAAIFVAFVISMAVLFPLIGILSGLDSGNWPELITQSAFDITLVAVGFCGVFAGSLCLGQASRQQGSIVLLILGLGFYIWAQFCVDDSGHPRIWCDRLVSLASGGFGAVILMFLRRPKVLFT